MSKNQIYIGNNKTSFEAKEIEGNLISFDNENYYKISNSDAMRPFFMSLVSDSNHWMFISRMEACRLVEKILNRLCFLIIQMIK